MRKKNRKKKAWNGRRYNTKTEHLYEIIVGFVQCQNAR